MTLEVCVMIDGLIVFSLSFSRFFCTYSLCPLFSLSFFVQFITASLSCCRLYSFNIPVPSRIVAANASISLAMLSPVDFLFLFLLFLMSQHK